MAPDPKLDAPVGSQDSEVTASQTHRGDQHEHASTDDNTDQPPANDNTEQKAADHVASGKNTPTVVGDADDPDKDAIAVLKSGDVEVHAGRSWVPCALAVVASTAGIVLSVTPATEKAEKTEHDIGEVKVHKASDSERCFEARPVGQHAIKFRCVSPQEREAWTKAILSAKVRLQRAQQAQEQAAAEQAALLTSQCSEEWTWLQKTSAQEGGKGNDGDKHLDVSVDNNVNGSVIVTLTGDDEQFEPVAAEFTLQALSGHRDQLVALQPQLEDTLPQLPEAPLLAFFMAMFGFNRLSHKTVQEIQHFFEHALKQCGSKLVLDIFFNAEQSALFVPVSEHDQQVARAELQTANETLLRVREQRQDEVAKRLPSERNPEQFYAATDAALSALDAADDDQHTAASQPLLKQQQSLERQIERARLERGSDFEDDEGVRHLTASLQGLKKATTELLVKFLTAKKDRLDNEIKVVAQEESLCNGRSKSLCRKRREHLKQEAKSLRTRQRAALLELVDFQMAEQNQHLASGGAAFVAAMDCEDVDQLQKAHLNLQTEEERYLDLKHEFKVLKEEELNEQIFHAETRAKTGNASDKHKAQTEVREATNQRENLGKAYARKHRRLAKDAKQRQALINQKLGVDDASREGQADNEAQEAASKESFEAATRRRIKEYRQRVASTTQPSNPRKGSALATLASRNKKEATSRDKGRKSPQASNPAAGRSTKHSEQQAQRDFPPPPELPHTAVAQQTPAQSQVPQAPPPPASGAIPVAPPPPATSAIPMAPPPPANGGIVPAAPPPPATAVAPAAPPPPTSAGASSGGCGAPFGTGQLLAAASKLKQTTKNDPAADLAASNGSTSGGIPTPGMLQAVKLRSTANLPKPPRAASGNVQDDLMAAIRDVISKRGKTLALNKQSSQTQWTDDEDSSSSDSDD